MTPTLSFIQNISIKRATVLQSDHGVLGGYIHTNGSYAAAVEVKAKDAGAVIDAAKLPQLQEFCSKVSQHIVAVDPGELAGTGLQTLGKQHFVFDGSMTINQLTTKTSKAVGLPIHITSYLRWKCGTA